jgi:hypothetical protein
MTLLKTVLPSLIAVAVVVAAERPIEARGHSSGGHHGGGHAHHFGGHRHFEGRRQFHHHGHVFAGPRFWSDPFWWDSPYAVPPPAVAAEPLVYGPPPATPMYRYYCIAARVYYPTAPTCPEAWIGVPAR